MNTNVKRLFFVVVSLSLLPLSAFAEEYVRYESPHFDFSMEHPENWTVREIGGVPIFLSPLSSTADDFAENVGVVVQDLGVNVEGMLEEFARYATEEWKRLSHVRIIDKGYSTVAGHRAYYGVYERLTQEGIRLRQKQYTILSGTMTYHITYSAEPSAYHEYLAVAERVMRSIRL